MNGGFLVVLLVKFFFECGLKVLGLGSWRVFENNRIVREAPDLLSCTSCGRLCSFCFNVCVFDFLRGASMRCDNAIVRVAVRRRKTKYVNSQSRTPILRQQSCSSLRPSTSFVLEMSFFLT